MPELSHLKQTACFSVFDIIAGTVYLPGKGRPPLSISDNDINELYHGGFTAPAIAKCLGCSASYVYNRMYRMGCTMYARFSNVSDQELMDKVSQLQQQYPNCGAEVLMKSSVLFHTFFSQRYTEIYSPPYIICRMFINTCTHAHPFNEHN